MCTGRLSVVIDIMLIGNLEETRVKEFENAHITPLGRIVGHVF